jgi:hypothetical protein
MFSIASRRFSASLFLVLVCGHVDAEVFGARHLHDCARAKARQQETTPHTQQAEEKQRHCGTELFV